MPLRRLIHISIVLIVSSMMLVSGATHAETRYRITDLGDLPGGEDFSVASGISESGLVVGWSAAETGTKGFLWDGGVMIDLGELPGGPHVGGAFVSMAYAVNDAAQVVGVARDEETSRAFRWEAGAMTDLGDLPGGSSVANARDINSTGQVVGYSVGQEPGDFAYGWATLWHAGGAGIEGLGDLPGGRNNSAANAINDHGQVVGVSDAASGKRAFLWEPGGAMVDLGDLPGGEDDSEAHDINNNGLVVGESQADEGRRAFLWEAGMMISLGDLGGALNRSMAYAINDAGHVVGLSNAPSGGDAGFIWDAENGMRNLNELIDPADPLLARSTHIQLTGAEDINEAGQIVGSMVIDGVRHAYLLTPVAGPDAVSFSVILLLILLLLILLFFIVRRSG